MPQRDLIEETISQFLGKPFAIQSLQSVSGGCINDAFVAKGSAGSFFIKTNRESFAEVFAAEALALDALLETNTVRVPKVLAKAKSNNQALLVLEYIEPRPSKAGNWRQLGEQLAKLHAKQMPYFGWHRDNWIGSTPQPNPQSQSWIDFFREHRLEHQIKICQTRGYELPGAKRLLENLESLFVGYTPVPSLLHGDLWSGNVAFAQNGAPFIFDPGSYFGDRETDIAFTEFFGGFSNDFYDAYNQESPLDSGYDTRKNLYNLYHCLNHIYLFGASYIHQAEDMTRQLLQKI